MGPSRDFNIHKEFICEFCVHSYRRCTMENIQKLAYCNIGSIQTHTADAAVV